MSATFFRTPSELRKWFERHHTTHRELLVGFYKKDSGRPSITWPESVDEALCVGWIDGIRRRVDDESYTIRFTPRKATSTWSLINIKRVEALAGEGRMRPAGLKAYQARRENKSGIYAYEQRRERLEEPYGGILAKNKAAWDFFQAQPPSYRKVAGWWVISAKKEETRLKRLETLIHDSVHARRITQFVRSKPPK